jgi:hypothetical protein
MSVNAGATSSSIPKTRDPEIGPRNHAVIADAVRGERIPHARIEQCLCGWRSMMWRENGRSGAASLPDVRPSAPRIPAWPITRSGYLTWIIQSSKPFCLATVEGLGGSGSCLESLWGSGILNPGPTCPIASHQNWWSTMSGLRTIQVSKHTTPLTESLAEPP